MVETTSCSNIANSCNLVSNILYRLRSCAQAHVNALAVKTLRRALTGRR